MVAPEGSACAILVPLPLVDIPFEREGIDIVGPLEKRVRGHQHVVVVVDYATWYPEMIPMCSMIAQIVTRELMQLLQRLPTEVVMDQVLNGIFSL